MRSDLIEGPKSTSREGWQTWASRYRWPLLLIALPTILTAIYYLLFAADQYVSDASFLVRSSKAAPPTAALGQMLGGGGLAQSEEAAGVANFLESHDAARELQSKIDITSMYRRTGMDILGRIKANPTEEDLTKFYKRHIKVKVDKGTGIIELQVRAFKPQDSKLIADSLLTMSEGLVNRFSQRAEGDSLRVASEEVARARQRLATMGGDPNTSATASVAVMGGLEAQLASTQAEFTAASAYLRPESPRLQELQARISGLQSQVETQRAKLSGPSGASGGFDRAITDREMAMREYQASLAAYQAARIDALKQHVYLVRVVEPNLAQKSLYPRRWLNILTVFACLCVAYGIGWLILTGTREHAA